MTMKFDFFPRVFEVPTDGGGAPAPSPAPAPAPAPTPAGTGGAAGNAPWYQGKADDRIIGSWQNNFPQHIADPAALAVAATNSWLEAQKALGVPADQIVRVPTKPDDAAGWEALHKRLGWPGDPTKYQFKDGQGKDVDPSLATFLRDTAHRLRLDPDRAGELSKEVLKFSEAQITNAKTDYDTKLAAGKAELATNWGAHLAANMEVARAGAATLGVDRDMVAALEQTVGYAKVMEMFRIVGSKTTEGKFVGGDKASGTGPMSREAAIAKKNELFADKDWVARTARQDRDALRELAQIEAILAASMAA
jgi:hypothetical protein